MTREPDSLRDLLDYEGTALSQDQLKQIEQSPEVAKMGEETRSAPQGAWEGTAGRAIGEALGDGLETPIADLLVQVWNKFHTLLKYRDKTNYPPDQLVEVTLADHAFKSTHEPRVAVLYNGKKIGEVPFTVHFALKVAGARVKIRDGRILSVATGKCHSEASLKCGGATLVEKVSKKFELPGRKNFANPIPIM
jgi:hypothetical protein